MIGRVSRRRFLKTTGMIASVATFGGPLFDRVAYAAPPFTRLDVGGLSATHPVIIGYKTAIAAMQALPAADPRNWTYQANIHGTYDTPVKPSWNTCQHGSWFFFSWHRMYLYWFERIVRHYSGLKTWALPFWNYQDPTERQIPSVFRTPTTGNVLYVALRASSMNTGGSLPASAVDPATAMGDTNFSHPPGTHSFGGQRIAAPVHFAGGYGDLEQTPHNVIHGIVGGFSGWMGDPNLAARDPIFWLHHSNIDRYWDLWLHQGSRNDPTSDSWWTTPKWTFFDENGASHLMSACEILVAQTQLGYVYQNEPLPQTPQACKIIIKLPPIIWKYIVVIKWPGPPVELGPRYLTVPVDVRRTAPQLRTVLQSKQDVVLRLENVSADRQPGIYWEVYVGHPDATKANYKDPHYVGNLAFFGAGVTGQAHDEAVEFTFPIEGRLRALLAQTNDKLQVSFVPRGAIEGTKEVLQSQARVRIGAITLSTVQRQ